jgi:lipoyl(octanoyl) transferase
MINRFTSSLFLNLGVKPYEEVWAFQKKLHFMRSTEQISDVFIFVEHDPGVYTVGHGADPSNYSEIRPILIERGGDVTYHGLGQLVIYPIVRVYDQDEKRNVRGFVNTIQNILMDSLRLLNFIPKLGEEPGIWVENTPLGLKKVVSLGMKIDKGVSYHGVAINYDSRPMEGFSRIRPCGLEPSVMGYLDVDLDKLLNSIQTTLKTYYRSSKEVNESFFDKFLLNKE